MIKQKVGNSSKICFNIKQNNFVELAGMLSGKNLPLPAAQQQSDLQRHNTGATPPLPAPPPFSEKFLGVVHLFLSGHATVKKFCFANFCPADFVEGPGGRMDKAIDTTAKALASLSHHVGSGKEQGPSKSFQNLIRMIGEAKTKHVR